VIKQDPEIEESTNRVETLHTSHTQLSVALGQSPSLVQKASRLAKVESTFAYHERDSSGSSVT
jgi:hypothetical protein